MTRKLALLGLVAALVVGVMPAAAADDGPSGVYVSLGTSLAAGTIADSLGNNIAFSDKSYTDQLHAGLVRRGADLDHAKLGCPGETTLQMLGGVNLFGQPSGCVDMYATGSQMGDALAAIAAGNVELVTIDIGANDILQTQIICAGDPDCIGAAIPGILANVGLVVGTLRASGYTGTIVGMNYYNPQITAGIGYLPGVPGQGAPDPVLAGLTDLLTVGFNDGLAAVYGAFGVHVADVYGKFNAGDFGDDFPANGVWDNIDYTCRLTYMCPTNPAAAPNIHANGLGYSAIAKAFAAALRAAGKA